MSLTGTVPRPALRFRESLESGAFTVTAEIGPPRGADPEAIARKVTPLRDWVAAVNITEFRAPRLGKKVDAGAQFIQTQYVFDVAAFGEWMSQVRDLGLHERCHILAGVGPISSLRALAHLERGVPGVQVPEAVARRLRGVPPGRVAEEGIAICAEAISELRQIPGLAGVHVMAVGHEHRIPLILQRAGVPDARAGRRLARADGLGAPWGEAPRSGGPGVTPREIHAR